MGASSSFSPPLDATLVALAAQNWAANAMPLGTGADALIQQAVAPNKFIARGSAGNAGPKDVSDYALANIVNAANAAAARAGLALGTMASQDADAVAVTGGTIIGVPVTKNAQGGTPYQTVLADNGKVIEMTNAAAATVTIPDNATVAFPTGTVIGVYAAGVGGVTIAPAGGVTIRNNAAPLSQYQEVSLRKTAANEWVRVG